MICLEAQPKTIDMQHVYHFTEVMIQILGINMVELVEAISSGANGAGEIVPCSLQYHKSLR